MSYFEEERLRLCMQKADGDGPRRPFHLVFHVPMRALLEAIDSNPAELAAILIVRGTSKGGNSFSKVVLCAS